MSTLVQTNKQRRQFLQTDVLAVTQIGNLSLELRLGGHRSIASTTSSMKLESSRWLPRSKTGRDFPAAGKSFGFTDYLFAKTMALELGSSRVSLSDLARPYWRLRRKDLLVVAKISEGLFSVGAR